jgi:spore maturation protein CgeB
MSNRIRFRIFAHSWISDWNHGNAHFLRGLACELLRLGHEVRCYEEIGSWSLTHLVREEGEVGARAIDQFRREFPELDVRFYQRGETLRATLTEELRHADVVIVHEWSEPEVVNQILSFKKQFGFRALFHDTHHRAYTNAGEMLRFNLHLFDGVLAFGEALKRIYLDGFGVARAWTFHEAADTAHFRPMPERQAIDVLWIGNWGDEERTGELMEFLVKPITALPNLKAVVHGVRYPEQGQETLARAGIRYRGYLPNLMAPLVYSQSAVSLHVPRRHYANGLSGIPTIRVFEALACGATLICAPWDDAEGLFRPGEDYIVVDSCDAMKDTVHRLLRDESARRQISTHGRETILRRHTCAHRAKQLVDICKEINQ